MKCPRCGSVRLETRDSRKRKNVIVRVRRCGRCKHRFRTDETPDARLKATTSDK
jgi:transcriptional regulator NrdR family protein